MDSVFMNDELLFNYEEYKEQKKEKKSRFFKLGLTPSISSPCGIVKNQSLTDFMLEKKGSVNYE